MNSIKKIGMITGFSIVLGAGVFMTNININNLFNDKVVYSDINEKVKEANQEKSEKTKVKKEAKKIKPSKDKNGAYNVNGTIIVNKKYVKLLVNGVRVADGRFTKDKVINNKLYRVYDDENNFIGLGERNDAGFKIEKLLIT